MGGKWKLLSSYSWYKKGYGVNLPLNSLENIFIFGDCLIWVFRYANKKFRPSVFYVWFKSNYSTGLVIWNCAFRSYLSHDDDFSICYTKSAPKLNMLHNTSEGHKRCNKTGSDLSLILENSKEQGSGSSSSSSCNTGSKLYSSWWLLLVRVLDTDSVLSSDSVYCFFCQSLFPYYSQLLALIITFVVFLKSKVLFSASRINFIRKNHSFANVFYWF